MTPPTPIAIFHNELAGSARTPRVREAVALARERLGADLHSVGTRDPDTLIAWMADRVEGYRTIVVVGGDGSLGVGYNKTATLIERMENEGLIDPANHAGKRDILVGDDEAASPY